VRLPTRGMLAFAFATLCFAQQSPVPVEQEPFHLLAFKNEFIEVMRVNVPPHQSTQFHTHGHDGIAVQVSNATITQQKPGEAETAKSQGKPGDVSARTVDTPYTHRVINQGATSFEVIDVEFLQRPHTPAGVAAGTVAAENPSARAYHWSIAAGDKAVPHTHTRPYLVVAPVTMQLKTTNSDGDSVTDLLKAGDFHWMSKGERHTLENVGTQPGEVVEIELK
jgi:quercetin dioxygenase-like cupin family protein